MLIAVNEGRFSPDEIVAELARGAPARRSLDDLTNIKSVGVAVEDLILSGALVDRASRSTGGRRPTSTALVPVRLRVAVLVL